MNLDTDLIFLTKINSKCITDLNVKCKTIKFLKDNIGENLDDLEFDYGFLNAMPEAQSMKGIIDKLDFIKTTNFHSAKVSGVKVIRRQVTDSEQILAKDIPDKGFPGGASGKEPTCQCRRQKRCWFDSWVGKIPWRSAWQPTPVFLTGESPRTEEPGGLQSTGLPRVGHN